MRNSARLFPNSGIDSILKKIWADARDKTELEITPHVLREWFANEMRGLRFSIASSKPSREG